jgi:hypothetical protein
MYVEMNKLMTTLATLTFGALGAFTLKRYELHSPPSGQVIRAVLSAVFCGFSLYAGYVSYETLVWMLHNGFFNLFNPHILWPTRMQFWTFIAAIWLLLEFVYRGVRETH